MIFLKHHISLCFSSLAIVLYSTLLSLRRRSSLSELQWADSPPRRPGGSDRLNYWEHKNAAANGSWINTPAKLLPRLPLLPRGVGLETQRTRTMTRTMTRTTRLRRAAETAPTPRPSKHVGAHPTDPRDLLTSETTKDVKTVRPSDVFFHQRLFVAVNHSRLYS